MSDFMSLLLATATVDGPAAKGITTGEPENPVRRTWAEVHTEARRMAGSLQVRGLGLGDAIAVLAGEPALIAPAVQAAWLTGASVTMLHQPTPRTDLGEWVADTLRVLGMIDAKLVLLGAPFDQLAPVLQQNNIDFTLLTELGDGEPADVSGAADIPEDTSLVLQLTSGSTADPKAVRITHGNAHANLEGMRVAAALDLDNDVMVSWLPLFHDMGMIGFLTVPMVYGIELVKVTPLDFLKAPLLWAELITRYRGTVTAAPNFAYALLARRLAGSDASYDLSSMRIALNGAEPIDPTAVRSFEEAGARFGMSANAVFPAYGMAETTLAVSFAPPGTGMRVDRVDAEHLEAKRQAVPSVEEGARAFPLLGEPVPGLEAQVVDEDGRVLADREVGQLRLRGAAVAPEYLTVDGTQPIRGAEGWMDTGDLGYTVDGQLVVCGRIKDVIIMGGRNIYPTDIERAAGSVEGVRTGNAVAVRLDAGSRRERFAVAAESAQAADETVVATIRKEIAARVLDAVGARPASILVLPTGSLPKTPSGKLRRAAARDLFDE
ncbi:long-chain fatty acid--CoA ligase [Pseudonocardiaceae bacterium YIM PH 21723]|nr:long-chain fatty acid--CoA ligase [Pseudonocardiaceae bacterium YIM PH 21723]